jgi:hypothetical protein
MSVLLDINGQEFAYPEVNDVEWGADATDWAVAVTSGMLQKAGGLFILLDDVDFGSNFGLISKHFTSRTANASDTGSLRLANTDFVGFRNFADDGDLELGVNSSDVLTFNGTAIGNFVTVSDTSTINLTLAAGDLSGAIVTGSITDSLINAAAAIAYSKLNLTGGIVDADVNASAAIARTKIASGTNYRILANSSAGVMSENAAITASRAVASDVNGQLVAATTTAAELDYVSGVSSAIQTQLNGKQATGNYITALTGDGTAAGPGSSALTLATVNSNVGTFASVTVNGKGLVTAAGALTGDATTSGAALTLATVNSNVGSFGSSTSIPSFTVNAKGLVTAASGNAVVAPAGTLTGTTLAATVVTSSLTALGTIGTGTWQGSVVGMTYGGTSKNLTPVLGGIVYTDGDSMEVLAAGNSGEVLKSNGASAPSWTSVLSNPMDSAGDMIYGGVGGAATKLDSGTLGQHLISGGAAAPVWTSFNSSIFMDTGNGHGSTNTKVRRFTNSRISTGTDITYADSATLGATFTINTAGVYSIKYEDQDAGGQASVCITVNGSALTTAASSLTFAQGRRAFALAAVNNSIPACSVTLVLAVNDIVRPQDEGANDDTGAACNFCITRVA